MAIRTFFQITDQKAAMGAVLPFLVIRGVAIATVDLPLWNRMVVLAVRSFFLGALGLSHLRQSGTALCTVGLFVPRFGSTLRAVHLFPKGHWSSRIKSVMSGME
jgi:hypothetical protein